MSLEEAIRCIASSNDIYFMTWSWPDA